jgi:hypothetical protein
LRFCDKHIGTNPANAKERHSFLQHNIESIAQQLWREENRSKSACQNAEREEPHSRETTDPFQRLFVHSLLKIGEYAHRSDATLALAQFDTLRRMREVRLKNLLGSFSWRLTRPLRELNRHVGATAPRRHRMRKLSKSSAVNELIDHQVDYLKYLRREIVNVRGSRSWKLTRFLRERG